MISPENYSDWKAWARALVQEAEFQSQQNLVNLGTWVYDPSKPRNGLPPAVKGDLIRVIKEDEVFLGLFNGTDWDLFSV